MKIFLLGIIGGRILWLDIIGGEIFGGKPNTSHDATSPIPLSHKPSFIYRYRYRYRYRI